MVSLVGLQKDFSASLKDLIELEYDASEAYQAAIDRLESPVFRNKLTEFKADHDLHIKQLTKLLESHEEESPKGPDNTKQWLAKGKVVLSGLGGDALILRAMASNEIDTNTAYERMSLHEDLWDDAKSMIAKFLDDERRHKAWLEEHIK